MNSNDMLKVGQRIVFAPNHVLSKHQRLWFTGKIVKILTTGGSNYQIEWDDGNVGFVIEGDIITDEEAERQLRNQVVSALAS